MGRELKRVPMSFDWPIDEKWPGYTQRRKKNPPKGKGYQLWENTSEGSPQTPVFRTLDELCEYAAAHCTTFASFTATKNEWRKMLDDGFVCHREGNSIFM